MRLRLAAIALVLTTPAHAQFYGSNWLGTWTGKACTGNVPAICINVLLIVRAWRITFSVNGKQLALTRTNFGHRMGGSFFARSGEGGVQLGEDPNSAYLTYLDRDRRAMYGGVLTKKN